MIGGLQGEFGDLDIKYLKIFKISQISKEKYLKMSVAHIWKLQENTAAPKSAKLTAKLSG